MKLRWWKKDKCECDLTKQVDQLKERLKIQQKETDIYYFKYNQEKERNLEHAGRGDFV